MRVEVHGVPILRVLETHVVLWLAHIRDETMNFLIFVCVWKPAVVQMFLEFLVL